MKTLAAVFVFAAFYAVGTVFGADGEYKPVTPGDIGKKAFDDLGAYYKSKKNYTPFQKALDAVKSKDSKARAEAAEYLLAVFKQAWEDESSGRSPWVSTPYWGGRRECRARNARKYLAKDFGKNAQGPESLKIAEWLLNVEKLSVGQLAGAEALCRVDTPEALEMKRKILAGPHKNSGVVVAVLKDVGKRGTRALSKEVEALTDSYKTSLRAAARETAEKLGLNNIQPFDPEKAFGPYLDGELKKIASLVATPIPDDAKWMKFEMKRRDRIGKARYEYGWLLKEDGDAYHVLDWFGQLTDIPKKDVAKAETARLADTAAEIAALKGRTGRASLSFMRELSAQFEPGIVSIPEALVGAWCYLRGDKKAAAKVLFPAYDRSDVDDWVFMIVRDLLGKLYHQKMLRDFSYARDYPAALRLAKHLAKPVFDGYQYQDRAKQLAEELPKRMDDFKTFVLPTPEEWKKMSDKMSKTERIEFLAEHLRLENCVQQSQPGDINLFDPQYRESFVERMKPREEKKEPLEVVNPYKDLLEMGLAPKDVKALLPYLMDDEFIPTFSYWRDFHPKRTLYHVSWLAADIINDSACERLVPNEFFQLDKKKRGERVGKIEKWCDDNASLSRSAIMAKTLRSTKDSKVFLRTAYMAIKEKQTEAYGVVVENATRFPNCLADAAELCVSMEGDVPGLVDAAKKWLSDKNSAARFQASMILLKRKTPGCVAEVAKIVDAKGKNSGFFRAKAVEGLLDNGSPEALKLADSMPTLKMSRSYLGSALHRLFIAGRKAALDFILEALKDEITPEASNKRSTADIMTGILDAWSQYSLDFDFSASEDVKKTKHAEAAEWVKQQFALIKKGEKPDMNTNPMPVFQEHWQVDAP